MSITTAQFTLLLMSLTLMLIQLTVKNKRLEHIFFAIFCGSMVMVAVKQLSAESLGPMQYLIGVGTCATCNCIWLVARSMFSGEKSIQGKHLLFAGLIAVLVISSQLIQLSLATISDHGQFLRVVSRFIGETITLLSSTVLALTFWEAIKGFNQVNKPQRVQRILFLVPFCSGVFLCSIFAKSFLSESQYTLIFPWLVTFSASFILLSTQGILWWRRKETKQQSVESTNAQQSNEIQKDEVLAKAINTLMAEQKLYLLPNLKMLDLATKLDESEYKISRVIRNDLGAKNFNAYINHLRLEHSLQLLIDKQTQHWTVLVIALESGFSSVTSFNRAFKAKYQCTPSEFRLNQDSHSAILAG
ncbi:helix-turn-helix domain-containing protein [Glaciecola sp. 1036]|uniref:AraC family transcriptional regulator n=1 Tax=Alteromonadaceae TaxID=72275 RepID=UPI003D05D42F